MRSHVRMSLALSLVCTVACLAAGAVPALAGMPVATGGQNVTQVAAGMHTPTAFAFGDRQMFAADGGVANGRAAGGVFRLVAGHARRLPGSPPYVAGIVWHAGTLYVTDVGRLLAWSDWNGSAFTRRRTIFRGTTRMPGFTGLGFAGGRLYAGVGSQESGSDQDDHGPTTLPYARDVLSFTPSGGDLRVFARGIRQPWQMTFPAGSTSPFISDLGQDSGTDERRVPDFVLRVTAGQNYGFPACNWVTPAGCAGRPRPLEFLAPHHDPMGLGIIGGRLYISEYGSVAPGPQVVSMPTSGGPLRTLLKRFPAPVVGLSTHAGAVYVGDETGRVYAVTP